MILIGIHRTTCRLWLDATGLFFGQYTLRSVYVLVIMVNGDLASTGVYSVLGVSVSYWLRLLFFRIGQTKDVKIYRLITRNTYEERLFECSSRKYGLDEAILGNRLGADVNLDHDKNIESLLKHGAYDIMKVLSPIFLSLN